MASAATAPYLSVEEYLRTSFRPDVDYVHGYIEERNLGEFDRGTLQGFLFAHFYANRREWNVRAALDTRLQVSPSCFRVPDLCITDAAGPKQQIIRSVPKLCIEVLSPGDTLRKMRVRSRDYFAMGVPVVWIFNPRLRNVTVCLADGTAAKQTGGILTLSGSAIQLDLDEIYCALDEA